MEAKSEVLNRVLLELPGRQPEIFILFTHNEFAHARSTRDGLDLAFERNTWQHSFKDVINGETVQTSIQKDGFGVWRALTVDGVLRMFDESRDLATFRRKNALSDIGRLTLHATDIVLRGDFARVHSRARGEWTVPA